MPTTKQDVAMFGDSTTAFLGALMQHLQRKRQMEELDAARAGATTLRPTGETSTPDSGMAGMQPDTFRPGYQPPDQSSAQMAPQFDQTKFLQRLVAGRAMNPYFADELQAQMAMRPDIKGFAAGEGIYSIDKFGGQPKQIGQVPKQATNPFEAYMGQGLSPEEAQKKSTGITQGEQLKGLTEKGNFPVHFDPLADRTMVVKPDGDREPYDATKHGNILAITGATTERAANIRASAFGNIRMYPMLDTKNGNAPTQISANDINFSNKYEPGRYVPASASERALRQTALLEDIRGNIQLTRESLKSVKEFDAGSRAKLAFALKDRDPDSAISSLIGGGFLQNLTPEQQDYVQNLRQLVENAMAMRTVLGAGQGSEDLRNAIRATIPSGTTPTVGYGLQQLDKFERVLDRLGRGIPRVQLGGKNPDSQKTDLKKKYNLEQ